MSTAAFMKFTGSTPIAGAAIPATILLDAIVRVPQIARIALCSDGGRGVAISEIVGSSNSPQMVRSNTKRRSADVIDDKVVGDGAVMHFKRQAMSVRAPALVPSGPDSSIATIGRSRPKPTTIGRGIDVTPKANLYGNAVGAFRHD